MLAGELSKILEHSSVSAIPYFESSFLKLYLHDLIGILSRKVKICPSEVHTLIILWPDSSVYI